jgi:hypothetical protein
MYNYIPNATQKLDVQPLMSISAAQTITYQFQVVEYMKDDKVMKVELQVQASNHDSSGNVIHSSGFMPVPRIQLPFIDHK